MNFAQKIKSYRQKNNWTQQDVAERLNVSRKTISSWENSRSYPDVFMLVQISDLYHVSLDDLLREDHKMIDNYRQEHVSNEKRDRDFRSCYYWNVFGSIFVLLKFIHVLPSWHGWLGSISGAVVGLTVVNLFFLLAYTEWSRLKNEEKISFVFAFLIITCLLIAIMMFNPLKASASGSNDYTYGLLTGQIMVTMIFSLSLTCSITLYSQFQERKKE